MNDLAFTDPEAMLQRIDAILELCGEAGLNPLKDFPEDFPSHDIQRRLVWSRTRPFANSNETNPYYRLKLLYDSAEPDPVRDWRQLVEWVAQGCRRPCVNVDALRLTREGLRDLFNERI